MNFRNSNILRSFGSPKGTKAKIYTLNVGGNEILFIVPFILILLLLSVSLVWCLMVLLVIKPIDFI